MIQLTSRERRRLTDVESELLAGFGPLLSETLVRALIDAATAQLLERGRGADLAEEIRLFATLRLTGAAILAGSLEPAVPTVLIVSPEDAFRSQLTAGWLRGRLHDRAAVRTAGLTPTTTMHPMAAIALRNAGISTADLFPKPLTDECRLTADILVSIACSLPGRPRADAVHLHWDEVGADHPASAQVPDRLRRRVSEVIHRLANDR